MKPSGGTATGDALATSLAMLQAQRAQAASGRRARSCCSPTASRRTAATRCRSPTRPSELGDPVYTVALGHARRARCPNGERVPPDTEALREIAERSGGRAFTAAEAGALSAVYERLGSQVATKREEREVTGAFAGGALVLLVGGSGLSLLLVPAPGLSTDAFRPD